MRANKILHSVNKLGILAAASLTLAALGAAAGCGSSSGETGTSTGPVIYAANLTRPAQGTVEVVDNKGDISASSSELTQVPSFLDISWVDISREGDNYKFTIEVAGLLPDTPQSGKALEWGVLMDIDQDGQPDWGVFAALSTKDGWYNALTNQKTKEKQAKEQFPGTFTHKGTTLTWTVPPAAIGSPTAFKWFGFANYFAKGSDNQVKQAADTVPEGAKPDNTDSWLPYP